MNGESFQQAPPATVDPADVKRTITPLRLIFWGGLLCVLDLAVTTTTNGRGFKFDFLNDAVGMILITVGVFKLAGIPVGRGYHQAMTFVKVMAVVATAEAAWDHFILPVPLPLALAASLVGLAGLAAIVVFCFCMREFCRRAGLDRPARSWVVTAILFIAIYLIPLGGFYLVGLVAVLLGESFHIGLGMVGLLLVPIFLVPLVHLFISTSRMKRAAEAMPPPPVVPPAGPAPAPGASGPPDTSPPPSGKVWLWIVLACTGGVAAAAAAAAASQFWPDPDRIEHIWECSAFGVRGEQVQVLIGSNPRDKPLVVVVNHCLPAEPGPEHISPGVYTFSTEVTGLRSWVEIRSGRGDSGGLWIDGKRRSLTTLLTVIYVSNRLAATELEVPVEQQEAFLAAARRARPAEFVAEWIQPRLEGK